jgi:hypothetical protein
MRTKTEASQGEGGDPADPSTNVVKSPGHAGPIMATDFLTPIAVLVLLFFASGRWRPKSLATLALEAELEVAQEALRSYRDALSDLGKE